MSTPSQAAAALARPHVLVVDDDPTIRGLVSDYLGNNDFRVTAVGDGVAMRDVLKDQVVDLLVLDLGLRGEDGMSIARRMRDESEIPMVMLTGRAEEADRVMGLELGADDYITKPFSLREFRSRVKAALRRAHMVQQDHEGNGEPFEIHELRIDLAKRNVRVRGQDVATTFVEFELLAAIATAPGRVWTRDMLLTRIWGDSAYRDPRTIDVHIRHLREKIESDAKDPEYLFTVRGVGYRFRDTEG